MRTIVEVRHGIRNATRVIKDGTVNIMKEISFEIEGEYNENKKNKTCFVKLTHYQHNREACFLTF